MAFPADAVVARTCLAVRVHSLDDGRRWDESDHRNHDVATDRHQTAWVRKVRTVVQEEAEGFDPGAIVALLLGGVLPAGVGNRTRTSILRRAGFAIGHASVLFGSPRVTGGGRASKRLTIGRDCFINRGCSFDATAPIDIGDGVALGHEVLMTTSSHDTNDPHRRGGALRHMPISVGPGVWIAARAVVLGGVTISEGAVVCAGAVVNRSVAAHTMVGGVPARHIRELPQ